MADTALPATVTNFRAAMAARPADPPMTKAGEGGGGGSDDGSSNTPAPSSAPAARPATRTAKPVTAPAVAPLAGEEAQLDYVDNDDSDSLAPDGENEDVRGFPSEDGDGEIVDGEYEEDGIDLDGDYHGMTGREILKAIRDGMLPALLHDKLATEYDINGRQVKLNLHEYPQDRMRQAEFSKRMGELKVNQRKAEDANARATGYLENQKKMFEVWRADPVVARRDLRRLGLGKTIFGIAEMIAKEMVEIEKLPPEARTLAAENKRLKEEREDQKYAEQSRTRRDGNREDEQKHAARQQELAGALNHFVPLAFERFKITSSPAADKYFADAFEVLWDGVDGNLARAVNDAAKTTKENLEDLAFEHAKTLNGGKGAAKLPATTTPAASANERRTPTRQTAEPMSPRRLPAAPPKGGSSPAKKGGTIDDFRKKFGR